MCLERKIVVGDREPSWFGFLSRSETRPAVQNRSSARPQRSDELAQAGVERAGLRPDGPALQVAAHIFGIRRDGNVTILRTLPPRLRDDGIEARMMSAQQARKQHPEAVHIGRLS